MPGGRGKTPLASYSLESFSGAVERLGLPRYRAKQVFDWYYKKGARAFGDMRNIPAEAAAVLDGKFATLVSRLIAVHDAGDGAVRLDMALEDGSAVEAVLIETARRVTLCLSSQLGCPLACAFCATGQSGFERNLHSYEIVEQALHAASVIGRGKRPSHAVFMGMGEPCLNLDAVFDSIRILNAPYAFNMGARRITISTLGFPKCIERIAEFPFEVGLAVSLHAAKDALRESLVGKTAATVAETVAAAHRYFEKTKREVTYEYVLLGGVNDSPEDAAALAAVLAGERAFVNLIAYNEVPGLPYRRPSAKKVSGFRRALETRGMKVHLRDSRGRGANAACGQLRLEKARGRTL